MKLVSSGKNKNITTVNTNIGNGYNNIPVNRNNQPLNRNGQPVNRSSQYGSRNVSAIPKPPLRKKSPVATIIIILLILVIGVAALFISLGFYVESLDTVFPNVWADGIDVSGLTQAEITQKLINEGYENNAAGISVTINFPDGSGFSFTGADVGLSLNAAEASKAVFEFGRTDTFFGNLRTYIEAVFERTDLSDLSTPVFDDSIMHALTAEYTAKFNDTLIDGSLDVEADDSFITVVKGTGLSLVEEEVIFNLATTALRNAVENHTHVTTEFVPVKNDEDNMEVQIYELEKLFERIHEDAVTPVYEFDPEVEGYITIHSNSAEGRTFNLEDAIERLRDADIGEPVVIHVETLQPDYTEADVKGLIFRDVLAESKTQVDGTSNRISNVHNAGRRIHNTILLPGEEFSFNGVVGQRTREKGFLAAGAFRSGRVEDVIGGGICQTASTLYDAVLHTHLQVTQRAAHGMIVTYLPFGNDATVNWPNLDLKFKNNTDFPIRIEHENNRGGRELVMRIIGTKLDDTYIEIETVQKWQQNYVTQEVWTDELEIGQTEVFRGFQGNRVETFKNHFTAEGDLISRTSLGISEYRLINRIVRHGTREPPPPPPPDYVPPVIEHTPTPEENDIPEN